MKTKIVSCHAADSKPVKQEVNGTMILPPSVFLTVLSLPLQLVFRVRSHHLLDVLRMSLKDARAGELVLCVVDVPYPDGFVSAA
jgi:hypothetical protein